MGGGGGNSTSKKPSWETGEFNKNPITAEDFNKGLLGDAQTGYLKGPTQTSYIGLGDTTKGGLQSMLSAANNNAGGLQNAFDANQGIIRSGGVSGDQRSSMDYFKGIMGGGGNDPAFERLKQNAIDAARTATNRQFAGMGRFGGSDYGYDVTRGIMDASAGMDYQNLQRRDAAASGLFNMGQTGQANLMGATDRTGGLYSNMQMPGQTQMQVGSIYDADKRAEAQFDPAYQHIAKYQGLLGQNASGPQPPQQPGLTDWLGLGIGAAGAFGPMLFSDERLKTDIKEVAKTSDGTKVYSYRMKNDPDGKVQLGVMAQDILETKPEAVAQTHEGLLMVDYGKALAGSKGKRRAA